jgi:phosphohistidine phosphatase
VCPGGGRIEHSSSNKSIFVYGYSQSYGQADHKISIALLEKKYSEYPKDNFKWSNEGY